MSLPNRLLPKVLFKLLLSWLFEAYFLREVDLFFVVIRVLLRPGEALGSTMHVNYGVNQPGQVPALAAGKGAGRRAHRGLLSGAQTSLGRS